MSTSDALISEARVGRCLSSEGGDFQAMVARDPRTTLPLTPAVFHILLTLSDGPLHGYRIMQEVERLTNGQTRIGQGTLYRSTERMLADGLIEEAEDVGKEDTFDARRRTYRLTSFGLDVARVEAERLMILMRAARRRGLLSAEHKRRSVAVAARRK